MPSFQIGWYSENQGLRLSRGLDGKPVTTIFPQSSPLINEEDRSTFARKLDGRGGSLADLHRTDAPRQSSSPGDKLVPGADDDDAPKTQLAALPAHDYDVYISRTWALVVISVAIIGVVVCLWMLVYVFQKMCDQTLQGSQTMGVLLLIGVTGMFSSVVSWLLPPNEVVCSVRHLMHPLLMVLCFAILVVKTMQLRSLVTIGIAGYIPMINQLVSLFFMVMVQVVIEAEWYFSSRPIGFVTNEFNYLICEVSRGRFLLLHLYPCALVLLAFCYGVSVINYKYNSNEGRWICISLIFIIPVLTIWLVVYSFAPDEFGDPTVSIALILISSLLLSILFVPKMIAISEQSSVSKMNKQSSGGGSSNIYSQWPQWNATYKGGRSWSPQKWFAHHQQMYPGRGGGVAAGAPFHHMPAQYGSDLFPLYSPSGTSGMTSNGSPAPPSPHRYAGRRRPRPRPLLPVYTSPPPRHSRSSPKRTAAPMPAFSYCAPAPPTARPTSYFYYGDAAAAGGIDPMRQRLTPSSSNRTRTPKSSAPSPGGGLRARIPPPDHQIVTKYVPEDKVRAAKASGIVVGGTCSCCEAGGRSIPKGSVTEIGGMTVTSMGGAVGKRKGSHGSSSVGAPLSHQQQRGMQSTRVKSESATSLVPSLIEADCFPGTVIITPDNESYGDEQIWTHKYAPGSAR